MSTSDSSQPLSSLPLSFLFSSLSSLLYLCFFLKVACGPHWACMKWRARKRKCSLTHAHTHAHIHTLIVSLLCSAEHKSLVVCEECRLLLRCKPPKVLLVYAAIFGRGRGQQDTCPTHPTEPSPFGKSRSHFHLCFYYTHINTAILRTHNSVLNLKLSLTPTHIF